MSINKTGQFNPKLSDKEIICSYMNKFNDRILSSGYKIEDHRFGISDAGALCLYVDKNIIYCDILWDDLHDYKHTTHIANTTNYFNICIWIDSDQEKEEGMYYDINTIIFEKTFDIDIDFPNFIVVITDYVKNIYQNDLEKIKNGEYIKAYN